ncbi:hypothetical protein B4U80_05553 [Leptotrombidium deliense]|uniref:Piwi domain-containing protein n=1 Tax=Leptotrombidium deliense TaxID=299467 RepID=A0A443S4V9_9ACAR|nr:hypothetical protein B4U80_05553 [Leptotrombidium deliense]
MNGVNWILDVNWNKNKKIMFVGVGVNLPSPAEHTSVRFVTNRHRIVSVVGSYDDTFARYATVSSVKKDRGLETVDLHVSIKKLLHSYEMHNKSLPDSIIIYRDHVSEVQFKQVMAYEVSKIIKSFETLDKKPKVTYIVVQRWHNTRFLPANRDDATSSLNIPVGTVVESIITDPSKFDFFICSQKKLSGVSIPSRYWVLFDENKFTADLIQEITFNMCFMHPSSTTSIRTPLPVKLANSRAQRARNHYTEAFEVMKRDVENLTDENEIRRRKQLFTNRVNQLVTVNKKLSMRLYCI